MTTQICTSLSELQENKFLSFSSHFCDNLLRYQQQTTLPGLSVFMAFSPSSDGFSIHLITAFLTGVQAGPFPWLASQHDIWST